jgi:hypothetical protein
MSKFDGIIEVSLKGKDLKIVYDWQALSSLVEFDGAIKEVSKPIDSIDTLKIAQVLYCGLKRYHPDMTIEQIVEWSPPLMRTIMVIDKALTYAYFGADGVPQETDDKKKAMTKPSIFRRLIGLRTE